MDREPVFIPIDVLHQLLICDADGGVLTWRRRDAEMFEPTLKQSAAHRAAIWNGRNAGKPALTYVMTGGYLGGTILGRGNVRAHRVIWAMHTGAWPSEMIDHINGDRADNRICNLRQATLSQNHCNRASKPGSSSAHLGVFWNSRNRGWTAAIKKDSQRQYLGTFACEEDAALAYNLAAAEMHGEFARLNRVGA